MVVAASQGFFSKKFMSPSEKPSIGSSDVQRYSFEQIFCTNWDDGCLFENYFDLICVY